MDTIEKLTTIRAEIDALIRDNKFVYTGEPPKGFNYNPTLIHWTTTPESMKEAKDILRKIRESLKDVDSLLNKPEDKLPESYDELAWTKSKVAVAVPTEISDAFWALSKLYQLRAEYWRQAGDWKPDWTDAHMQTSKECIIISKNKIERSVCVIAQNFLVFKPGTGQRDHFLQHHRELIEQAKPLL